jgi:hypothetical protein
LRRRPLAIPARWSRWGIQDLEAVEREKGDAVADFELNIVECFFERHNREMPGALLSLKDVHLDSLAECAVTALHPLSQVRGDKH